MGSGWVAAIVVVLTLASCGDASDTSAAGDSTATSGDADEVVAAAVEELFGDTSFRSRTVGKIPFLADLDAVYEQSGDEVVDITSSDGTSSATVISGGTAYDWNASSQSWNETPLTAYDPLLSPGFMFVLSLVGLFDTSDASEDLEEMPPVVTGWVEVDGEEGTRRFERTLPSSWMSDPDPYADDAPVERLEESAIVEEFYRAATTTSTVDVDSDGHLVRHRLVVVFDGAEEYPGCLPFQRFVGTSELVVEFSDVGNDFTVTVPTPEDLVAEFPELGEAPDFSESGDPIDGDFRDDSGARDLSGCPTP